eukprot:gb/GFBE01071246.1/.p1 GENE.gb/GFBE01071246.1/~~gb/GFBE01071246.1/.p1  ORF type:complete len:136 (+),score=27.18 gb/GFBE01071246.1/:1-408(+)
MAERHAEQPLLTAAKQVKRSLRSRELQAAEVDTTGLEQCTAVKNWGCEFKDPVRRQDPEVKARCLDWYNHHVARVRQVIPADRLLTFNLSDGWPPLANFLNKTIPDEEFPYSDRFTNHGTSLLQQSFLLHDRMEL